MKRWMMGLAVVALVAAAGPVQAITVDDVIGLTRADASDAIIMSKIEVDGTVFHLTVGEILQLKEAGVSDPVITYMINTGKIDLEPEVVEEAPPLEEEEALSGEYEEEYASGDDGYYSTSLDSEYRSSVGVSVGFGWYYPFWPGFSWSFYYGPYWWGWQPWYYAAWAPYPYYCGYYGYGYGYGCGYCGYYSCRYYHYPTPYYHYGGDSYAKVYKGRDTGNRGSHRQPRVIKGPGPSENTKATSTRSTYRSRDPSPRMVANNELKQPGGGGGKQVRPSDRGSRGRVDSPRPARVIRSTPTPVKQVNRSKSRNSRSVRSGPARQNMKTPKAKVKSAPPPRSRGRSSMGGRSSGGSRPSAPSRGGGGGSRSRKP
jgi:hypothetical protein